MSWVFPERLTREYQETLEIAKAGLTLAGGKPAAFGRFTGRKIGTYTWNEWTVKNWLDVHGFEYFHNYKLKVDAQEGSLRRIIPIEFDFYVYRHHGRPASFGIEVQPLFHSKTGHQVTQRVMLSDYAKQQIAKTSGIDLIEIWAYDDVEDFAEEITTKLGPLTRY